MLDIVYVVATLSFFGLMWAYARACEYLGREPMGEKEQL